MNQRLSQYYNIHKLLQEEQTGESEPVESSMPFAQALEQLGAGNENFLWKTPSLNQKRRLDTQEHHDPYAVIVSCCDARVAPEIIFDQYIGDLFVVRTFGNVVDDLALASIEYAIERLKVQLVLVLGHEKCDAVAAAMQGDPPGGHFASVVEKIRPALARIKDQPGDALTNAINANVLEVVAGLQSSEPLLAPRVQKGMLKVVGARYDLSTGKVEFLEQA